MTRWRVITSRKMLKTLKPVLQNEKVMRNTKRTIYKSLVKNEVLYRAESWDLRKRDKDWLKATEMDFRSVV